MKQLNASKIKTKDIVDISPRKDGVGKIVYMCRSGNYVMVRRPGFRPFLLTTKEWAQMPFYQES